MQGNDSFRLIVRRGPQPNQTYDLNKDITTLGRDITNDIVINDPEVSRHHLRFIRGGSGFTVEDLGSTNGTFVNGQRVASTRPLNHGDLLGLGETVTLGYERVRTSAAPVTESPAPVAPQMPPQQPAPVPAYTPQPQPEQQDYGQNYQQPANQGYYQPSAAQEQQAPAANYAGTPGYSTPSAYGAPQAPAGYDYDPYMIRDEPRSPWRWIGLGCLGLAVFCCCVTGVGLVFIDALNLWYELPIISDLARVLEPIARTLGF